MRSLVVASLLALITLACDRSEPERHLPSPHVLPDGLVASSIGAARTEIDAEQALVLDARGESVWVFTWTDGRGNYDLAVYRNQAGRWTRYGDLIGASGFDPPRLVGTPPTLRMYNRGVSTDFALTFDEQGPVFLPARE